MSDNCFLCQTFSFHLGQTNISCPRHSSNYPRTFSFHNGQLFLVLAFSFHECSSCFSLECRKKKVRCITRSDKNRENYTNFEISGTACGSGIQQLLILFIWLARFWQTKRKRRGLESTFPLCSNSVHKRNSRNRIETPLFALLFHYFYQIFSSCRTKDGVPTLGCPPPLIRIRGSLILAYVM